MLHDNPLALGLIPGNTIPKTGRRRRRIRSYLAYLKRCIVPKPPVPGRIQVNIWLMRLKRYIRRTTLREGIQENNTPSTHNPSHIPRDITRYTTPNIPTSHLNTPSQPKTACRPSTTPH